MPESSPHPTIYFGSARVPKEPSRFQRKATEAMQRWFDRIGPNGIEKRFVESHAAVLSSLSDEQRKSVFSKEVDAWRKSGKHWGIAATVIDTGLTAFGLGFSFVHRRHQREAVGIYTSFVQRVFGNENGEVNPNSRIGRMLLTPYDIRSEVDVRMSDTNVGRFGSLLTGIPAAASILMLVTEGPAHKIARLAARWKEKRTIKKLTKSR